MGCLGYESPHVTQGGFVTILGTYCELLSKVIDVRELEYMQVAYALAAKSDSDQIPMARFSIGDQPVSWISLAGRVSLQKGCP